MPKLKRKTDENTVDAMAPSAEFLEAKARWTEISAKHQELVEKRDALGLALSLAASPENARRVSDAVRQFAHPYKKLAERRRSKAIAEREDTVYALDEMTPAHSAEAEIWAAVRQRETNRLGCLLQPRHRAAVKAMAAAMEALSRATADECDVRDELRRLAPLPISPNLPDLSSDLCLGQMADWGGVAWTWARRLRTLGILED